MVENGLPVRHRRGRTYSRASLVWPIVLMVALVAILLIWAPWTPTPAPQVTDLQLPTLVVGR